MTDEATLFDEEDRAIFSSEDLDLKAKVVRYHLLPRLEQCFRTTLDHAQQLFSCDPLEASAISRSPGFRTDRRVSDVRMDYRECTVSLTGTRKPIWTAVKRAKDERTPKILWFKLGLELSEHGLMGYFSSPGTVSRLTNDSMRHLTAWMVEHSGFLSELMRTYQLTLHTSADDPEEPLMPISQRLSNMTDQRDANFMICTRILPFPITDTEASTLSMDLACLFPVYDTIMRTARGVAHRLDAQTQDLNHYTAYLNNASREGSDGQAEIATPTNPIDLGAISIERTTALPAMRFRVFQRDGWKCISCGRSPVDHEIVLHVDHIIPKSHGGLNEMDNYQTLCDLCNLGKGNRDRTDIRLSVGRSTSNSDVE